jgi:adenylyltransferase/sulfurtransferase
MDPATNIRHARHLTLPQIGVEGQRALESARVLIVGLGGLGSPVSLYLAAAGIGRASTGRLVLADFDTVELSNLQRQIAHDTAHAGVLKTHSARDACLAIDPDLTVDTIDHGLDEEDLVELLPEMDLVLDCTDNFPTRFALNAACVAHRVPLVTGAAIRFDGQVSVVDSRIPDAPCYRCLYTEGDETADNCVQAGILGPVVGVVGCMQALEAIKLLVGIGDSLAGRLLLFDGLAAEWNEIQLTRRADCPVCQLRPVAPSDDE